MLTPQVIEGFVNAVLADSFQERASTPEAHREWWELCCDPHPRVAIAAPRGHAKSTAITHAYVLAATLFREHQYVLIVSDTEAQAVLFLQDIKKEILDNEKIHRLFPMKTDKVGLVRLVKETEADIIVEMADGYQFRIMAKGSEQKVRGLKWGSKRPDLIIGDDLENDEIVMNKDRRDKFLRWFYGALLPCLSKSGKIRIVGTILHMDSLLNRLMPRQQLIGRAKFNDLSVTALREWTDRRMPWKSVLYRAHGKDYEPILWQERFSRQFFVDKYNDLKRQGIPETYAQEYLNEPLDESTAYFRRSDFIGMSERDKNLRKTYYIVADLAISEKERADYSVFMVAGMDEDRFLHIEKVLRARLDGREIVDLLYELNRTWKPEGFGIETEKIDKAIKPFLFEKMRAQGEFFDLIPLKPSKDKETRGRSIQARMRSGSVKFDKVSDWYPELEEECLRFPRGKHDDQVDCLAYIGLLLDKLNEAPTNRELIEEDRAEMWRHSGLEEQGRNQTTGY